MRVLELHLEDLRRFERWDAVFAPGLTALVGPNGSGKSTLLEAIGFALFGVPPTRDGEEPGAAVRDGAAALVVEARFAHRGRDYIVRRSLARRGGGITAELRDAASGAHLASGDDATTRVIAESLLRLTSPALLALVFRRLAGIAQGGIVAPFLLPAEERRRHFAPLLDLDRYPEMATAATALGAPYRTALEAAEVESRGDSGALAGVREARERMAANAAARSATDRRLQAAEARVEELALEARRLESARAALEAQTLERAVLEQARASGAAETARALKLLEEAEQAQALVVERRSAHARFEALESQCRTLALGLAQNPDLRADVAALEGRHDEERSAIDGAREAHAQRLEESQRRAEELLAERDAIRAHLEALRDRARHGEGAISALATALGRSAQVVELLRGIEPAPPPDPADERAVLREERARLAEREAVAAAHAAREAEMAALRARARTAGEARTEMEKLGEASARLDRLLAEVRRALNEVRPAMGACPLLHSPCKNVDGQSLIVHFEQELGEAEAASADAALARAGAERRLEESLRAARALAEKEREPRDPRPAGKSAARPRSGLRPGAHSAVPSRIAFDDIGHHLSALAGVIGAITPAGRFPGEPVALIAAVAGEAGPVAPQRTPAQTVELPGLDAVEHARELAREGALATTQPESPECHLHLAGVAAELARRAREIHAQTQAADAQFRALLAGVSRDSREAEALLQDGSKALDLLALERTRARAALKEIAARELRLLDVEIALSDRQVLLGAHNRLEHEIAALRREQESLRPDAAGFAGLVALAERLEACRDDWKRCDRERLDLAAHLGRLDDKLHATRQSFDASRLEPLTRERDSLLTEIGEIRETVRTLAHEKLDLGQRIAQLDEARVRLEALDARRKRALTGIAVTEELAALYRGLAEPMAAAARLQIGLNANRLYRAVSRPGARLTWGDDFALSLATGAHPGKPRALAASGRGDQTTAALALLIGLLEASGRGLGLLLLDEPSAHLDRRRQKALAAALAGYRDAAAGSLEQVIVASHDPAIEAAADLRVRLA